MSKKFKMKTKKENRAIILKGIKLLVSSTESETSNETQEINHALVIKWIEWSVFIFSAESKIEIETQINWTISSLMNQTLKRKSKNELNH